MLKILKARNKAEEALGDQYDIREFHDVVLKNGALPMMVLMEQVDQYIERKLAQQVASY